MKRYSSQCNCNDETFGGVMVEDAEGEYVKTDDVLDFLEELRQTEAIEILKDCLK